MFAVMVPIFVIFLAFLIDVGQLYYEKSNAQRAADSVIRTVEKVLGTGAGGERIAESEVPSTVKTYSTYADLKNDYPDAATELEQLESDIKVLAATLDGMTIEQKFMVDGDGNFYYRVDVAKTYNAVMKIASAADGSSSTDAATVTATMIIKFASENNIVTGGVENVENPAVKEKIELLTNAEIAEAIKIATVKEILNSGDIYSAQEKGEMFNAYLTSKLTATQLGTNNETTYKVNFLTTVKNNFDTAAQLKDFLLVTLNALDTVTVTEAGAADAPFVIKYEDASATTKYHTVTIDIHKNIRHTANN